MYFAALQEVQSDKCKLLSFPVLVWRLVKIWVAGRPQIVYVLFFLSTKVDSGEKPSLANTT